MNITGKSGNKYEFQLPPSIERLTERTGVYIIYDRQHRPICIGESVNVKLKLEGSDYCDRIQQGNLYIAVHYTLRKYREAIEQDIRNLPNFSHI